MSTEQQSGITITDIALAANAIEVACSRGAFRADEMEKVGAVYNRFAKLLRDASEAQQKQEQAEQPTQTATAATGE